MAPKNTVHNCRDDTTGSFIWSKNGKWAQYESVFCAQLPKMISLRGGQIKASLCFLCTADTPMQCPCAMTSDKCVDVLELLC